MLIYVCTDIHLYICVYTYIHVYHIYIIHIYICIIHIYIHAYVNSTIYEYIYTYMSSCMYIYMYICIYKLIMTQFIHFYMYICTSHSSRTKHKKICRNAQNRNIHTYVYKCIIIQIYANRSTTHVENWQITVGTQHVENQYQHQEMGWLRLVGSFKLQVSFVKRDL